MRGLLTVAACLLGTTIAGHAQSPAVSGLNGRFSLEGGAIGNQDRQSALGITQGSITAPIGHSFGVQVDGTLATAFNNVAGGGVVHAFWRDPAIGLLGPVAAIIATPGSRTALYLGEAEYYAGMLTVGAVAGYAEAVSFGPSSAASGGFYLSRATLYPIQDLALSIEGSSSAGRGQGRGMVEYQPGFTSVRGMTLFANGSVGENASYSVTAGVKFYFGADKPLIRRHREDDPHYTTFDGNYWHMYGPGRP